MENYVNAQSENPVKAFPRNRSYSSTTKFGKKAYVVQGVFHLRNFIIPYIRESTLKRFQWSQYNWKKIDQIVIICVGSNDITHYTVDQIDVNDIANRIINIGKKCLSSSVK